ncbi:MAG TPA: hypothetical protein VJ464_26405 [Blastocatellia bacterium]|nr:hypothetical protein [Blastocatellia bacterium]
MSSIKQDPNTLSDEKENFAESLGIEAIENLARLLKEQAGRPHKQPLDTGNLLDGDIKSIETQLDATMFPGLIFLMRLTKY